MRAVNTTKRLELSIEQQRMRAATTVREANPRINQLAVLYDLKPSNTKHYKFMIKYMELSNEL